MLGVSGLGVLRCPVLRLKILLRQVWRILFPAAPVFFLFVGSGVEQTPVASARRNVLSKTRLTCNERISKMRPVKLEAGGVFATAVVNWLKMQILVAALGRGRPEGLWLSAGIEAKVFFSVKRLVKRGLGLGMNKFKGFRGRSHADTSSKDFCCRWTDSMTCATVGRSWQKKKPKAKPRPRTLSLWSGRHMVTTCKPSTAKAPANQELFHLQPDSPSSPSIAKPTDKVPRLTIETDSALSSAVGSARQQASCPELWEQSPKNQCLRQPHATEPSIKLCLASDIFLHIAWSLARSLISYCAHKCR